MPSYLGLGYYWRDWSTGPLSGKLLPWLQTKSILTSRINSVSSPEDSELLEKKTLAMMQWRRIGKQTAHGGQ